MDFEWDQAKAESNLRKHGISFSAATRVFDDAWAIERPDARNDYGEDRFILIGEASGEVLVVVFTERVEGLRIISARRASKNERVQYYGNRSL